MKKSKFTEAQIVFAIKQSETGVTVAEVCRKMGIHKSTFYISLDDTGEKIEHWRQENNSFRPHSSLGDLTPEEFLQKEVVTPGSLFMTG